MKLLTPFRYLLMNARGLLAMDLPPGGGSLLLAIFTRLMGVPIKTMLAFLG